jgi:D-xylose 1-dehydrogenase
MTDSSSDALRLPGLRGKHVLLTGGATGIGREIVCGFARQGCQVSFLDIDRAGATHTLALCKQENLSLPTFFYCDLTDIPALQAALAQAIHKNGDVQILVNNAAHDDRHAWGRVDGHYFDGRIAVNLKHVFFAMQAIIPSMQKAQWGVIVNMGSVTPAVGLGGMPIYSASKAAILGLTRSAAKEFGKDGIRINAVIPGAIATERQKTKWYTPEVVAEIAAAQCLPGEIKPEDVANMVLFLASDAAAMCSAQSYAVDAGWM